MALQRAVVCTLLGGAWLSPVRPAAARAASLVGVLSPHSAPPVLGEVSGYRWLCGANRFAGAKQYFKYLGCSSPPQPCPVRCLLGFLDWHAPSPLDSPCRAPSLSWGSLSGPRVCCDSVESAPCQTGHLVANHPQPPVYLVATFVLCFPWLRPRSTRASSACGRSCSAGGAPARRQFPTFPRTVGPKQPPREAAPRRGCYFLENGLLGCRRKGRGKTRQRMSQRA